MSTKYNNVMTTLCPKRLLWLLITLFLLISCTFAQEETSHTVERYSLDDTEWKLLLLNGQELLNETAISMKILKTEITGYGGCNFFESDGEVTIGHGVFLIEDIESTARGCQSQINEQESAFYEALTTAVSYSVTENHLELSNPDGIIMVFESK